MNLQTLLSDRGLQNRILRAACEKSFHTFLSVFWNVLEADPLIDSWYIRYQCDVAQNIVERVAARLPCDYRYYIINVPPGSSKSTIWSRMLPVWAWVKNDSLRLITASYSEDIAMENAEKSQIILQSQLFREVFPRIITTGTKTRLRTSKNGVRYITATGSKITGRHADLIIPDDPENTKQAESEAERKKATDFVIKTLSTRKRNQKVTPTVIVQQRLHEKDTTGEVLALQKKGVSVFHISLPATHSSRIKPIELEKHYSADESGKDSSGIRLLDPLRFDLETLSMHRLILGSYAYAGQFEQEPAPEEGAIWKKWFVVVPDEVFPDAMDMSDYGTDWDLAYTAKEDNSASAFVTAGKVGGNMYIDKIGYFHLEFPDLIEKMHRLPAPHYIEKKASGLSASQVFRKMHVPAIEVEVTGGDKIARARIATPYAQAGFIHIRESLAERIYNDENQGILRFPKGRGNDLADALAQSINRLLASNGFFFGS